MKVLAADMSTSVLSLAICERDRILMEYNFDCGRTHAERTLDTLDWMLRESGMSFAMLDGLAVSRGPGSFTGVRVGVSLWKGLALANELPLVGVSTLDAMARSINPATGTLCVMIDAKMKEVFAAAYQFDGFERTKIVDDCAVDPATLAAQMPPGTVFAGDGAVLYAEVVKAACPGALVIPFGLAMPRAAGVAFEAMPLLDQGAPGFGADVTPVYLRPSQAEQLRAKAASL